MSHDKKSLELIKYNLLLGMVVISRGSLKLDHDGHFSFCL